MNKNEDIICQECIEYIYKVLDEEMKLNNITLEGVCKKIMIDEIIEPSEKAGIEPYQVTKTYKSPWDADNVNLMLALYCVLFPRIKSDNMICLRSSHKFFYKHKREGRIGETMNSFGTMFGTERAKDLLKTKGLENDKELKEKVKCFKHLYRTPANFLPFPGSLNNTKGFDDKGWNYLGDFFDEKLKIIKNEWDNIMTNSSEVPLLNDNREYFSKFSSFKEYCEYMFLGYYINPRTGEIVNLCNHDGKILRLPTPFDKFACEQYIDNATSIIHIRGLALAEYLFKIMQEYIQI